jgi:hypothetical protein
VVGQLRGLVDEDREDQGAQRRAGQCPESPEDDDDEELRRVQPVDHGRIDEAGEQEI